MRKGSIYLPEATWDDLQHDAAQLGTTTAALIRQAVADYLRGRHAQRLDHHDTEIAELRHRLDRLEHQQHQHEPESQTARVPIHAPEGVAGSETTSPQPATPRSPARSARAPTSPS